MSLNPLTLEEYEAEKRLAALMDDPWVSANSEQVQARRADKIKSEMAQLCRAVETGTAQQILKHIEFIDTIKLAANGFAKEASAISAARVACDRLIQNKDIQWFPIATAPRDARWLQVKMTDGSEHRAHYAEGDGENMPPFKGWFIQVEVGSAKGGYFSQIDEPAYWRPEESLAI